uniref:Uncharacterized protein n=1 Tax=Ditylenchus dipsaci TaxID=166011 RepID=A0A915DK43_9BILA
MEYGSNKYACQKGTGGFGTIRRSVPNITSSRHLSESNDGVIPWHSCPPLKTKLLLKLAILHLEGFESRSPKSRACKAILQFLILIEFYSLQENEKKKNIQLLIIDPITSNSFLKLWGQPNPEAKMTHCMEDTDRLACLPKFQRFDESSAARNCIRGKETSGINRRQVTTLIRGLDMTTQEKLDSNKYMSWVGGQVSLQSQSHTGGFNKTRDVVGLSYYAKLMSEKREIRYCYNNGL